MVNRAATYGRLLVFGTERTNIPADEKLFQRSVCAFAARHLEWEHGMSVSVSRDATDREPPTLDRPATAARSLCTCGEIDGAQRALAIAPVR